MELIRGLQNLTSRHRGCVASIGNFDGVHLGHRAVIKQLLLARSASSPATVITFEPQPAEYFAVRDLPPRLTSFREKLELLDHYGVERILCLRFARPLAEMQAQRFIQLVLIDGLAIRHLVIGDDFRFGKGRAGDFGTLVAAGERHGFSVERTQTYHVDGERVSSTKVRLALGVGDLSGTERLLGRSYEICGRVAHGDKRGRDWGFPTANIHLNRRRSPLSGIFAVEVSGIDSAAIPGVANLGNRPTVDGTRTLLEVHLLDFNRDIYGRRVMVRFLSKLRDERRFDSFDALKVQIARDVETARDYFHTRVAKCS